MFQIYVNEFQIYVNEVAIPQWQKKNKNIQGSTYHFPNCLMLTHGANHFNEPPSTQTFSINNKTAKPKSDTDLVEAFLRYYTLISSAVL